MVNTKISNIIYPEQFKTNYIFAYTDYQDELRKIIQQSGRIDDIIKNTENHLLFSVL